MSKYEKWVGEFFNEPLVKEVVGNVEDFGTEDLVLKAFEICHAFSSFANDYNCPDQQLQGIWAILRKYNYSEGTSHNWEENPYGEEVYNYLERTFAPKLETPSWVSHLKTYHNFKD